MFHIQKCFVFIPGFIGRLYNSGNECNWTNTEQLVFTKPCPQKGFMKIWNYVFQTFQFRLNLTDTKPQFAEIFRYYITEADIIQNRGFRSTLKNAHPSDSFEGCPEYFFLTPMPKLLEVPRTPHPPAFTLKRHNFDMLAPKITYWRQYLNIWCRKVKMWR